MMRIQDYFINARKLNSDCIPIIDFHIHTNYTDGNMTVEQILNECIKKGLTAIAFTDHARHSSSYIPTYIDEIKSLSRKYQPLKVYCGLEVKIVNRQGDLDISPETLELIDFCIAVIHRFPSVNGYLDPYIAGPEETGNAEVDASIGMMERGIADVLGHPGMVYKKYFGEELPEKLLQKIIKKAKDYEIAIEINTKSSNWDKVMKLAIENEISVSIGSDAHELNVIGTCYSKTRRYLSSFTH